jgi:hypothetical protein
MEDSVELHILRHIPKYVEPQVALSTSCSQTAVSRCAEGFERAAQAWAR